MRKIVNVNLMLVMLAAGIFAANLKNQDSTRYEIKIIETSTTTNSWIDGNTTVENICSECEIQLVSNDSDSGKIKVGKNDVIVIKDGKLSKE